VLVVTAGSRDVGRSFVIEASSGDAAAARARLHEALAAELGEKALADMFRGARPYVEVSFGRVEASASGTVLEGRAETADGCTSSVALRLLDEKITSFDITPLCRREP
jgi:hypothetical protein